MGDHARRVLGFSLPFLTVEHLSSVRNLSIPRKTIVLNTSENEVRVAGRVLRPWNSSIYSECTVVQADSLICMTLEADFFSCDPLRYGPELRDNWVHVHDVSPERHSKAIKLWKSSKDRVNSIEFNLWFAMSGTHCGIHRTHDFRELHTQVFGLGRMQEFHRDTYDSLYQQVFMGPGYTHESFYDDEGLYPWHQYYGSV